MRFLLAALQWSPHRPPAATYLSCPGCDLGYAVEWEDGGELQCVAKQEWEALVKLQGECPDHAHRFAVEE